MATSDGSWGIGSGNSVEFQNNQFCLMSDTNQYLVQSYPES